MKKIIIPVAIHCLFFCVIFYLLFIDDIGSTGTGKIAVFGIAGYLFGTSLMRIVLEKSEKSILNNLINIGLLNTQEVIRLHRKVNDLEKDQLSLSNLKKFNDENESGETH